MGDDLRQVDWRLYARSDQLHCRLQSPDAVSRLAIVLDASASMGYRGARAQFPKLRTACIVAACVGYLAERQGDEVALFCYGASQPVPGGRALSFMELCRRLEALEARGVDHAARALAPACEYVQGRGMVLWLSDFLGEENALENALRAFQTAGKACYACQVLDDDELRLPLMGSHRFQDPEDAQELVTDPEPVRQEYLAHLGQFLEKVQQSCMRQSVPFERATATTSLAPMLVKLLSRK